MESFLYFLFYLNSYLGVLGVLGGEKIGGGRGLPPPLGLEKLVIGIP
jgi:hypothetical protein